MYLILVITKNLYISVTKCWESW